MTFKNANYRLFYNNALSQNVCLLKAYRYALSAYRRNKLFCISYNEITFSFLSQSGVAEKLYRMQSSLLIIIPCQDEPAVITLISISMPGNAFVCYWFTFDFVDNRLKFKSISSSLLVIVITIMNKKAVLFSEMNR